MTISSFLSEISLVQWLVVVSVLISIGGTSAYIRDTLRGKSKPNRVSWLLWGLAPLIGSAAALSAHADIWPTIRVFFAGFLPLLVFCVSFINPRSYWKLTKFDIGCGVLSLAALIAWLAVGSAHLAIILAATADGFASIPTIRKAWRHPETETRLTYLASTIAIILALPSIPQWNIENSTFQIYLLVINAALLLLVYRKPRVYNISAEKN